MQPRQVRGQLSAWDSCTSLPQQQPPCLVLCHANLFIILQPCPSTGFTGCPTTEAPANCYDFNTDEWHCGGCNTKCPDKSQCLQGKCTCNQGECAKDGSRLQACFSSATPRKRVQGHACSQASPYVLAHAWIGPPMCGTVASVDTCAPPPPLPAATGSVFALKAPVSTTAALLECDTWLVAWLLPCIVLVGVFLHSH